MPRFAIALFVWMSTASTTAGATEQDLYFLAAYNLHSRGASIAGVMTRYKHTIRTKGTEQRQADLALLWSIAETGSMCAILGADIVGAVGLMDSSARADFKERMSGSVGICLQFIEEKVPFLNALTKARNDEIKIPFAGEIDTQLRALRKEFTDLVPK